MNFATPLRECADAGIMSRCSDREEVIETRRVMAGPDDEEASAAKEASVICNGDRHEANVCLNWNARAFNMRFDEFEEDMDEVSDEQLEVEEAGHGIPVTFEEDMDEVSDEQLEVEEA